MIYLVRHGQTEWNLENRRQGHMDIPLNSTGKKQAKLCGQELSALNLKIDQIISSDLSRAKETAEIINTFLHLPISFDSRLREGNRGDLEGTFRKDISDESWYIFNIAPHKLHAESYKDIYNRAKSFFDALDTTKNTLVVTHGGFMSMVLFLAHHPHAFRQKDFLEHMSLQFKAKSTEIFKWDKNSGLFQSIATKSPKR